MPVLVYQMGRVGSTTVMGALKERGIKAEHAHYAFHPLGEFTLAKHLNIGKALLTDKEEWRIISIAREPMARNLSAFLFGLNNNIYPHKDFKPERLMNLFVHTYRHDWCFNWFTNELGQIVNVYEHRFNREMHYQRFFLEERRNFKKRDVVIIRTENFGEYGWLWQWFLGQENLRLETITNSVSDKFWYYHLLKQYMRGKLPKALLTKYYFDEPYTKHFYSLEERKALLEYWSDPFAPMVEW